MWAAPESLAVSVFPRQDAKCPSSSVVGRAEAVVCRCVLWTEMFSRIAVPVGRGLEASPP